MNTQSHNRISHIDSLRGIAALLVVYLHVSEVFLLVPSIKAHGTFLYDIAFELNFGRLGVVAFFAISGFVICPSLKGQYYEGARKFLISRFFRLFPAFWVAMFLSLLVKFVWQGRDVDWSQVLGNLPMLYSYTGVDPLQGLYWTLEVELVFYLMCLGLFLCGWLHKPVMLFVVGLALTVLSQWILGRPPLREFISAQLNPHWVEMPRHLAIMFWGGLFRAWYDDRQRVELIGAYKIPVIVFVAALLVAILLRPAILIERWVAHDQFQYVRQLLPYFLGLGFFIVGALYVKLNNRFFIFLGAISYSLYLLHPVVFLSLLALVNTDLPKWGSMHLIVYLLICTVFSILLAALVYHFIEKPAIRMGRYLQAHPILAGLSFNQSAVNSRSTSSARS